MAAPRLKLGGIEVPLHAGAPRVAYSAAGGAEDARLSGGKLVRMRHWKKWQITISGTGWMATGLDVLDWDEYQDLWCPKPKRVTTTSTEVRIQTDARPDVPVEAHALVGRGWQRRHHHAGCRRANVQRCLVSALPAGAVCAAG